MKIAMKLQRQFLKHTAKTFWEFLYNLDRDFSYSRQNLSDMLYSIFDPCIVDNLSKKLQIS